MPSIDLEHLEAAEAMDGTKEIIPKTTTGF